MSGFLTGLLTVLSPATFVLLVVGTSAGIIIGAIPGLTGAMGIALVLPMTFYMSSANSLTLLIAMYVGSVSGALITATLLNIPGTPAAIMTTLDAYPMARSGQAGRALGLGIGASLFGGLFSWAVLVTSAYPLSEVAVRLKPFDIFSLVLMALVLIASVGQGSVLKSLVSGLVGILVALPGTDPATGDLRLTFGFHELDAGFSLLPVLIGVYALGQILSDSLEINRATEQIESSGGRLPRLATWRVQLINLLRSSAIGTWVGILPGIGANIGSLASYTVAKTVSKTPEKFGTGFDDGVVASEAANNATVGGALIPLICLGIPGSVVDAFLLGALIIHGVRPGPLLFANHPEIVHVVFAACLLANITMFVIMLSSIRWISNLIKIPNSFLFPLILVFCVIGAYANSNRIFDIWVMLAFGLVGFAFQRAGFSLGSFVIGFILAPIAEKSLRAGLMLSGGTYLAMVTEPVSAICLFFSAALLIWSLISQRRLNQRIATSINVE